MISVLNYLHLKFLGLVFKSPALKRNLKPGFHCMRTDVKECKKQRCDTQHEVTVWQYVDKFDDGRRLAVDLYAKITM
jgi:hypothetical protein